MSRIPFTTTDQQPEPIRQFMARRGDLNLFRLLANAPAVFIGWAQMVDEMLDSPTFTARMRELIILRVAHLQGSPYELSQHLGLARSARRGAATARSGRSGHQGAGHVIRRELPLRAYEFGALPTKLVTLSGGLFHADRGPSGDQLAGTRHHVDQRPHTCRAIVALSPRAHGVSPRTSDRQAMVDFWS